jgi:hypothetical protein
MPGYRLVNMSIGCTQSYGSDSVFPFQLTSVDIK